MKPQTRRILFSLAVLIWSGILLYFYASGRVNKYLATDFRPLTLAGGLGMAVMGFFNLLTAGYDAGCEHEHDSGDMHPLTAILLMLVPVALSVAWTKDSYSLAALSRKGLYDSPTAVAPPRSSTPALTREQIEKTHRKTADGFLQFNLLEISFATGDRELQPLFDGLKVETIGRWIHEKSNNPKGTRKRLYRLFMNCCVADSRAIPIVLEFEKSAPEFPENAWVKVNGTMRFPLENGAVHPVLMAEHAEVTDAPQEEIFMRN